MRLSKYFSLLLMAALAILISHGCNGSNTGPDNMDHSSSQGTYSASSSSSFDNSYTITAGTTNILSTAGGLYLEFSGGGYTSLDYQVGLNIISEFLPGISTFIYLYLDDSSPSTPLWTNTAILSLSSNYFPGGAIPVKDGYNITLYLLSSNDNDALTLPFNSTNLGIYSDLHTPVNTIWAQGNLSENHGYWAQSAVETYNSTAASIQYVSTNSGTDYFFYSFNQDFSLARHGLLHVSVYTSNANGSVHFEDSSGQILPVNQGMAELTNGIWTKFVIPFDKSPSFNPGAFMGFVIADTQLDSVWYIDEIYLEY